MQRCDCLNNTNILAANSNILESYFVKWNNINTKILSSASYLYNNMFNNGLVVAGQGTNAIIKNIPLTSINSIQSIVLISINHLKVNPTKIGWLIELYNSTSDP